MHFQWDEDQIAYRENLQQFLAEELPENWAQIAQEGIGGESIVNFSRNFCGKLAERGWLTQHWPSDYYGQDAPHWNHFILSEEMYKRGEPRGPQLMNLNFIGPAIIRYGTDEQKKEHLGRMARGEAFWCQGYSEPEAGSDLVSLRTTAIRDGNEYVINGNKIWTSYADVADTCIMLARTDPNSKKHHGISVFLIPMDVDGLTVQDIPSVLGAHYFHRMTFDNVRVPASCLLGDEHRGWDLVKFSLQYERLGSARYARDEHTLELIAEHLKESGRIHDVSIQEKLGRGRAAVESARTLCYRVVDMLNRGEKPGVEANLARVAICHSQREIGKLAVELLPDTPQFSSAGNAHLRIALQSGIAGGTWEVQLNLIARYFLDLPQAPRRGN